MEAQHLRGLFDSPTRLFHLRGAGPIRQLWPEAWVAREALSRLSELRILCLSHDADLALDQLVSRPITLLTTLSDGTRATRSGLVRQAERLGGDGALTRYRLTVAPWLWLATRRRNSRIYEGTSVRDILARVLDTYRPYAYTIGGDVDLYLSRVPARPYTTQYRETDYQFLDRLMAESGLGWTVVEDEQAAAGHRIRIFAESRDLPWDGQSGTAGIRYARNDGVQASDNVQALVRQQRRTLDRVTLLGWRGEHKRAVRGEALARPATGTDDEMPGLEHYEVLGHDGLVNDAHGRHLARVVLESALARADVYVGRGTVRGLRSGTRILLRDMPTLGLPPASRNEAGLLLERIEHVGVNNLPRQARQALDHKLGDVTPLLCLQDGLPEPGEQPPALGVVPLDAGRRHGINTPHDPADDESDDWLAWPAPETPPDGAMAQGQLPDGVLVALAAQSGYANRFQAIPCDRSWRAPLPCVRGARLAGAPTVHGVHSAVVVDAQGHAIPSGANEVCRNARGDVRIRFPWQDRVGDGAAHSRWARVAQRQAAKDQGMSFVPRIGQEVLVRFLDDDIDQPVVLGAVYNGRGEGGIPATPAGQAVPLAERRAFAMARDNRPSARLNLTGGHAPAWHGASPEPSGHNNPAALMGIKTKEFGGPGYNQTVFDDSDGQLRVQLKTTQAASELNLGHIIHQAGNYRGSFRGEGAELRTDGHGAVRGGAGVLFTTYRGTDAAEGAGELSGGEALAVQAQRQAQAQDDAAHVHQGVRLAATAPGGDDTGDTPSPLDAFTQSMATSVHGAALQRAQDDVAQGSRQPGAGKVPHLGAPAVIMAARAGLVQVAGQHVCYASGRVLHWGSGGDSHWAAMATLRVHSGRSLDILGGATRAGAGDTGLRMTSAHGDVQLQAQRDAAQALAHKSVTIASMRGRVDQAAPRRLRIAVAGGASIVLEGGNITVTAPGKIEVKAGDRRFSGPDAWKYPLPQFSTEICIPCAIEAAAAGKSMSVRNA